jgi:parallel beta-helix repeat protein
MNGDGNTIANNTLYNNLCAIDIYGGYNNIISGNTMEGDGILIDGSNYGHFSSHDIYPNNTVNGRNVYYYVEQDGLGINSFTNAGQVILIRCNNSLISKLNISQVCCGIFLYDCNGNNITENVVNDDLYGIFLYLNCDNNTIINNIVNGTVNGIGIFLYINCDNNIIMNNIANNNVNGVGIYICEHSNNNTILGNTANDNYIGITSYRYCNNNTFLGNTANDNYYGIGLDYYSNNNTILENIVNNNDVGIIGYRYCKNNTISGNTVNSNGDGISLNIESNYNTIVGNLVSSNNNGIILAADCDYNLIFNNIVFNNSANNGLDQKGTNKWDNGTIGNCWGDYAGVDANYDGIGDTPYDVPPAGGSVDNYPIYKPNITITFPNTGQIYGNSAPDFEVEIFYLLPLQCTFWYTIDGGLTNISFNGLVGTIDQNNWSAALNGLITIRFYVRDIVGNIAYDEIIIIKVSKMGIDIIEHFYSKSYFNFTFYLFDIINPSQGIEWADILSWIMWWNRTDVSGNIIPMGSGYYSISLEPIFISPGENPILLNMSILAKGYEECYYETYISVEKEEEIEIYDICVEIMEQLYSEKWFNLTFYVYNASNPTQGIEWENITEWLIWWNGTDVKGIVIPLGGGYYRISLEPITVLSGEDAIPLNGMISATGFELKEFEFFIAVDPELIDKTPEPGPSTPSGGGGGKAKKAEEPAIPIITLVAAGVVSAIGAVAITVFILRKRILPKREIQNTK